MSSPRPRAPLRVRRLTGEGQVRWARCGAALALALGAAACQPGHKRVPPRDVVATVNGERITTAQLHKALSRARRDDEDLSPRTAADAQAFRESTLDDLIDQTVLLQAARAANVQVSAERVDRELLRLRSDYPGHTFDQALAKGALTQEELRTETQRQLTIEAYFVQQVYAHVAITDAEIGAYYAAHTAAFSHPEQVHAEQILVAEADTAKKVQAELRKGKAFEELARTYSISPDARVGGDLGWFAKGVMPEAFDRACFALEVGQVSAVTASPYGYHLFKLLGRRPAGVPALASIRPKVEAALRKEREVAAQKAQVKSLRQRAKIEINPAIVAAVR